MEQDPRDIPKLSGLEIPQSDELILGSPIEINPAYANETFRRDVEKIIAKEVELEN